MKWKIGNVEIDNQVVLAPMAGICNSAFRRICKEMGCGLIYAEMVSDKAITFQNQKTIDMLYMTEEERPLVQQIFGSDKESFVEAARYIYENMHPDIIDINMGCPVPKIAIKSGGGSALLKDPELIREIVETVVAAVDVPVTVKIRSGWDSEHINAVEIATIASKAGAKAIAIHARTRAQGYSGKADWNIIKEVVNNVDIPVIGNGDILSCYDASKMLVETGCTAVMIGRGVMGNPWLIKECVEYLDKGIRPKEVTNYERIDMMEYHLQELVKDKCEKQAVLEMRGHILNYLKSLPDNKEIKNKICQCKTKDEIINILEDYRKKLR